MHGGPAGSPARSFPEPAPPENPLTGLSDEEARRRLSQFGPNEIPKRGKRGVGAIVRDVVTEPMVALLIVAGVIYLMIGELRDSMILIASMMVLILITIVQHRKTENALDSLQSLSDPWALVLRGGHRVRIPRREVVPGDIMLLLEGDRVPADGCVVVASELMMDESSLTGESIPVRKREGVPTPSMEPPGPAESPYVFAGTLVVKGTGSAQVLLTGVRTEFGKIGAAVQSLGIPATRLEKETRALVLKIGLLALVSCISVPILYGLLRGSWTTGFLAGVTLAMGIIPEEIPLILTIFFALGAARIAREGVLTRRFAAIEALGSTTVLCVDKTGTLTQNKIAIHTVVTPDGTYELARDAKMTPAPSLVRIVDRGVLASDPNPFDPLDLAFGNLAPAVGVPTLAERPSKVLVHRYPFRSDFPVVGQVWRLNPAEPPVVAIKGAPEFVLSLCGLSPEERASWDTTLDRLAGDGLRLIGVAESRLDEGPVPDRLPTLRFQLLGVVGMEDPVRPDVRAGVKTVQAAGVRVVMVTGDHPRTAAKIARDAGIPVRGPPVTGAEISKATREELRVLLHDATVVARATPEQKLRIVQALQDSGEVVGMTGDGVNDAPALKKADIGIAMGQRGTDVAREAAQLVLLEDSFLSVVAAMRTGRRVVENLKKAVSFLISVHIPMVGLVLLPVVMGFPLLLFPIHIVFLQFLIDPAVSIGFEGEAANPRAMHQPPRSPSAPVYGLRMLGRAVLEGLTLMLASFLVLAITSELGYPEAVSRGLSFTAFVVGTLALMFSARRLDATPGTPTARSEGNPFLLGLALLIGAVMGIALFVPAVSSVFDFSTPPILELSLAIGFGALAGGWRGILRLFTGSHPRSSFPSAPSSP